MHVGDSFPTRETLRAAVDAFVARYTPQFTAMLSGSSSRDGERKHRDTGRPWTEGELSASAGHRRGAWSSVTFRCSGFRRTQCGFKVYAKQADVGAAWCVCRLTGPAHRGRIIVGMVSAHDHIASAASSLRKGVSRATVASASSREEPGGWSGDSAEDEDDEVEAEQEDGGSSDSTELDDSGGDGAVAALINASFSAPDATALFPPDTTWPTREAASKAVRDVAAAASPPFAVFVSNSDLKSSTDAS